MRNLLALVGLAVIGFGGAGWYLGWYKLSYSRTPDGQLQINTTVDTKKAADESSEALKNLGSAISTQVEKAGHEAKTAAPASAPAGTQGPVLPAPQALPPVPLPEVPSVAGPLPAAPSGRAPTPIPLLPPKP